MTIRELKLMIGPLPDDAECFVADTDDEEVHGLTAPRLVDPSTLQAGPVAGPTGRAVRFGLDYGEL